MDADTSRICFVQGESGARVYEQISVDSVARVESLSDRGPSTTSLLSLAGYIVVFDLAILSVLLLAGVDPWEF